MVLNSWQETARCDLEFQTSELHIKHIVQLVILLHRITQVVCGSTPSLSFERPVHGLVKYNRSCMTEITENKLCVPRTLRPI